MMKGGSVVQEASSAGLDIAGLTDESATLDFKRGFDPKKNSEWCELIKDIVAMANSGGGRIVIGVNDDGVRSDEDLTDFLKVDLADITNKIHKYTEQQFANFRVDAADISGSSVAVLSIDSVRYPIVFSAPGEYETAPGNRKSAFAKGTTYFRHGAKSEPGTSDDLRNALERELVRVKDFWLAGITKVVEAPSDSEIRVVQADVSVVRSDSAQPIRLTDRGDGPIFKVVDNDQLYPYRAKELLKRLHDLVGPKQISSYDIRLARRTHQVDSNPNYSYQGRFGSRQYSEAFVEFLVSEYRRDHQCFHKLREISRLGTKP
jgi:hypothetical protein